MAPKLFTWLSALLLGMTCMAQGPQSVADSLRRLAMSAEQSDVASDKWLELSKHYRKTNLDSSQAALDRAIAMAVRAEDKDREIRCIMSKGALRWMQGNLPEAERCYLLALAHWRSKGAQADVARCLLNLGNVSNSAGKLEEAIQYLRQAIPLARSAPDPLIQAQAAGTLASLYFKQRKPDSVLQYSRVAEEGFLALKDSANLARVNTNLSLFYREMGMSHEARAPIVRAQGYLRGSDELGLKGEVHENYGLLEYKVGNYEEAIRHILLSRECFQRLRWHKRLAFNEDIMGICYKRLGRNQQAKGHFETALHLNDSIGNTDGKATTLTEMAGMLLEQKAAEKAVRLYGQALGIRRGKEDRTGLYEIFLGLGRGFAAMGAVDSSTHYLALATQEATQQGKQDELAHVQLEQARLHRQEGNLPEALTLTREARKLFTQLRSAQGLSQAWDVESLCLESMGRLPEALEAARMASQWQDSVQSFSAQDQLLALEARYWSEHKQHDLEMALQQQAVTEKEAQRAAAEAARSGTQRNMLVLVLSLVVVLAVAAYWISQKVRKATTERKLSEMRMVALRAQMNPHFIFNALGSVQMLINTSAIKEANLYLSKFAQLLRITLERSSDSESTLKDELDALRLYIELEALRFKFRHEVHLDPELSTAQIRFPTLLLQPLVENAVKHGLGQAGGEGLLTLRFSIEGTELLCQVEDNGPGRKASALRRKDTREPRHRSMGLEITQQRLDEMQPHRKGRLSIHDLTLPSGNPCGTRVEVRVPLTHL